MIVLGVALLATSTLIDVYLGSTLGIVSGVKVNVGGLAATDPKLVSYGALTATFHTGIGCLVGPSILYLTVRALVG
ncbi:malonate transporter subunit MadL [Methylobacterium sp. CM6257]